MPWVATYLSMCRQLRKACSSVFSFVSINRVNCVWRHQTMVENSIYKSYRDFPRCPSPLTKQLINMLILLKRSHGGHTTDAELRNDDRDDDVRDVLRHGQSVDLSRATAPDIFCIVSTLVLLTLGYYGTARCGRRTIIIITTVYCGRGLKPIKQYYRIHYTPRCGPTLKRWDDRTQRVISC